MKYLNSLFCSFSTAFFVYILMDFVNNGLSVLIGVILGVSLTALFNKIFLKTND